MTNDSLPDHIQARFSDIDAEVQKLVAKARSLFVTELPGRISFRLTHSGVGDMLSVEERAQSVSFITRYDHLPEEVAIDLANDDGTWHIQNLWVLRHILNDFRPIIQNQKDSVFYQNVHNVWYRMLRRNEDRSGMRIRVYDETHGLSPSELETRPELEVAAVYAQYLGEHNQATRALLNEFEYGYLYNGILQHSDHRYSKRFFADYTSGELNYLFVKHVRPLGVIKTLLAPYYQLMTALVFPSLGPL